MANAHRYLHPMERMRRVAATAYRHDVASRRHVTIARPVALLAQAPAVSACTM
jgi:hypothetical protein